MIFENKMGDIHTNFFCSNAGRSDCPEKGNCISCPDCHHKWPRPEEFKVEYGEDYSEDGAVWVFINVAGNKKKRWFLTDYGHALGAFYDEPIVCACTPFGKPKEDWRSV